MTVLVIGGGCGGLSFITALRKLDPAVEIVLVEPKDFCELLWASYRSPFDEQIAENSTFPLDEYCEEKSVRHLRTKVIRMTTNEAELEDGTIINFDSAVVSVGANIPWSGSGNGLPVGYDGSREERLKIMKEQGGRLLNAKKVVIVGGGLIGVELAGGKFAILLFIFNQNSNNVLTSRHVIFRCGRIWQERKKGCRGHTGAFWGSFDARNLCGCV